MIDGENFPTGKRGNPRTYFDKPINESPQRESLNL